jgi:hypothetical protein
MKIKNVIVIGCFSLLTSCACTYGSCPGADSSCGCADTYASSYKNSCNCVDPSCSSSASSCIGERQCCNVFGNIAGYYDGEPSGY